jgi:hypothetical protein
MQAKNKRVHDENARLKLKFSESERVFKQTKVRIMTAKKKLKKAIKKIEITLSQNSMTSTLLLDLLNLG